MQRPISYDLIDATPVTVPDLILMKLKVLTGKFEVTLVDSRNAVGDKNLQLLNWM